MSKETSTYGKGKTPKTASFSIPKGYEKEVAYLNKQPNKSQYIWNLIREDMKKQSEDTQILEIVRQAMKNISLDNNPSPKQIASNFDEDKRKKGALAILQE